METPFREDGTQYAWDSTSLGWAMACLRKYKFQMIDRLVPKSKSYHLLFGGWYAHALEEFYKLRVGMGHDAALRAVVWQALKSTWIDGKPWQSPDPNKTRENLIRSIIWYADTYVDDSVETVILPTGLPAVEHSFRIEIDYGNFYSGHIDRLVTYGGQYYVMDQKTTGHTITTNYFAQYDTESQMSGYIWAGQAIYEAPVRGVIIDAAQIAVGFTRFERGYTYRTEDQLDEWYESALYHIDRAQQAVREQYFPPTWTSCYNCDFKGVCSKGAQIRASILKGDFETRVQWNPLVPR